MTTPNIGTVSTTRTLACFLLLISALLAPPFSEAAVNCDQFREDVGTCIKYLLGRALSPSRTCCNGMKALSDATDQGTEDNRAACECIRNIAAKTPAFRPDRVMGIRRICSGVTLPFEVFINSGCSTYYQEVKKPARLEETMNDDQNIYIHARIHIRATSSLIK
ncbi:hypothetical protein H6P81_017280 [Aristolochia fimbriata]|uniref:Bifunctional inhibitor/plant lipid transfer protein/seed storage helical domain-containing protein n=1 Tax=Aristolochia fimbriata TaxID=158543 RepID=A0AAV7DZ30_ARIFI|nr:hypothetical protein H6P81_017280 [Aristolochia fimbriata]